MLSFLTATLLVIWGVDTFSHFTHNISYVYNLFIPLFIDSVFALKHMDLVRENIFPCLFCLPFFM